MPARRAGVPDGVCWCVVCWWCGGAPAVVGRGFRMSRDRPRGGYHGGGAEGVPWPWRGVPGALACVACRPEWGAVGGVPPGVRPRAASGLGPDTGSQPARRPRKGAGPMKGQGVRRPPRGGREQRPGRSGAGGREDRSEGPAERASRGPDLPTGAVTSQPHLPQPHLPQPHLPQPHRRQLHRHQPIRPPRPTTSPPAPSAGCPNPPGQGPHAPRLLVPPQRRRAQSRPPRHVVN
ncbi:UNVERIFIED_ORG: hypothetical protein FHR35_008633 [Microbispora rosea subsp. rosea]